MTFTGTHEVGWRPSSMGEALALLLRALEAMTGAKRKAWPRVYSRSWAMAPLLQRAATLSALPWVPALTRHWAQQMLPCLREMLAKPAAVAAVEELLGRCQHEGANLYEEVAAFLERYRFPEPREDWLQLLLMGADLLDPDVVRRRSSFSPGVALGHWLELAFLKGPPSDRGSVPVSGGHYPVVHMRLWEGLTRREAKNYLCAMSWGLWHRGCTVIRCLLWETGEVDLDTWEMVTPPWEGRPGKLLGDYYASLPPEGRMWPRRRALRWLISRLVDQLPLRWWPGGAPPKPERAARYWAKLVWDGKSVQQIAAEEDTDPEEVRLTLWRLGIASS